MVVQKSLTYQSKDLNFIKKKYIFIKRSISTSYYCFEYTYFGFIKINKSPSAAFEPFTASIFHLSRIFDVVRYSTKPFKDANMKPDNLKPSFCKQKDPLTNHPEITIFSEST